MHFYVNNYKNNDLNIMLQKEDTFGSLDVIGIESKYWATVNFERETVAPKPSTLLASAIDARNSYGTIQLSIKNYVEPSR